MCLLTTQPEQLITGHYFSAVYMKGNNPLPWISLITLTQATGPSTPTEGLLLSLQPCIIPVTLT
jgi:hypothetical protein